ncbi:hypothetical protein EJV47_20280 [Hymenobacter gummosus]|uniref:T9SS type A sorting domain-containing protein n=1 Tax=Hymenobacter gummosus TaxID=1776032 RepID=A0A3S0J7W8_9BACT|nr:hypothetical protein EJV47_20280 [Hymenobacter gummosus]
MTTRRLGAALLGLSLVFAAAPSQAQVGKDGPFGVGSPNTIVNRYTALTANAAAGNDVLSVASTADLSAGDLVMVIQMQGASINTANTSSYGTVTALNNAGNMELAVVQRVASATSVVLSQRLTKSYTSAGRAQLVRVPRFSLFVVNPGATVTAQAWNGSTGGVLAVESQNEIIVNGTITATGKGFRGGAFANNGASNNANYVGSGNTGGQKGESIAGYETSYSGGSRGRGAPANGGGGGNSVNAGGGGGANGGDPTKWSGRGNPTLSIPEWASAWNLEEAGFATSTSSGGGRGGYGVSDVDLDALSVGPDRSAWGDYSRPNTGGIGGRPLDYSTGRLFLGGGGGAGDGNTDVAGYGGNGGGLVFLLAPTINGGGVIESNGSNGNFSYANNPFADGAGGGGAGGTIVVQSSALSNLTLRANGGDGGGTDNTIVKAYGPGGGGGAGYIGISTAAVGNNVTVSLNGGNGGMSSSPGMAEFPPNGATRGAGTTVTSLTPQAAPLPVTWAYFTASWAEGRSTLTWGTAMEKNSAYFQPERSLDGGYSFQAFGEAVPAAGHSTSARRYTAYDAQPPVGKIYYRIRQVDTDGTSSYTAAVLVTSRAVDVAAYPNPVRRGQPLRTTLPAGTAAQLTDVLGRLVAAPVLSTASGTLDLDTRALRPGQYWLRVPGGKAQRISVVE